MVNRADRLDPATLDAPIQLSVEGLDDERSVRWLLSRLIGQLDMWSSAIANRAHDRDLERGKSTVAMRSRLASVGQASLYVGHVLSRSTNPAQGRRRGVECRPERR